MKICTHCRKEKTDSEFWKDKSLKSGLCSWCKACLENNRKKPENVERRRMFVRRYQKTAAGKEAKKRATTKFFQTHRGRLARLRGNHKYYYTPDNRPKMLARWKVRGAIRAGRLVKPANCSNCSKECLGPKQLQGHHFLGYAPQHWYDVKWLCPRCHQQAENPFKTAV